MISGKPAESIVDAGSGITSQFQGDVELKHVDLTDLEEQTGIQGTGDASKEMRVVDRLTGVEFTLHINDDRFFGWDETNHIAFFGRAKATGEIKLRHPDDPQIYAFIL